MAMDLIQNNETALENVDAGVITASKAIIVGANKEVDELHIEDIYLGAGAGTQVTATAADLNKTTSLAAPTSATPVNAVAATETLTISGVVIDGETVSIGDDVYEFCADTAQSLTAGSTIAVDITAVSTASEGTLTIDTNPTAGDTMTIGAKVYTFVPNGTANADGEIDIGDGGSALADVKVSIVAAINGTDGYNVAHTLVSAGAFAVNDCVITALVGGVAGDSIATTETLTAVSNIFDGVTLGTTTPGVDCVQAAAVTALAAAITASDTQGVGGADGAGDTVVLTADTAGVAGNAIVIAEAMANGAFGGGATELSGGVDGTVGTVVGQILHYDASYLYYIVAANTISNANWRRVTLGSAY